MALRYPELISRKDSLSASAEWITQGIVDECAWDSLLKVEIATAK